MLRTFKRLGKITSLPETTNAPVGASFGDELLTRRECVFTAHVRHVTDITNTTTCRSLRQEWRQLLRRFWLCGVSHVLTFSLTRGLSHEF